MKQGTDFCRDQELRFTVHESADYFRLKVSVFNDDKKTDLIGETWVDLKDLIIPGGSQGDHWHPLQSRGKYAGEVRIEMTYYDTRPEDEAVIERRRGNVEKAQEKSSGLNQSSSLSGPRQPKDLRRRPLPNDPSGLQSARPPRPEKMPSAPAPAQPLPLRPSEHPHFAPPIPNDPMPQRHPAERPYDMAAHGPSYSAPHNVKAYDTPDDFHRQWDQVDQIHAAGSMKHQPQGYHYEDRHNYYDLHPQPTRRPMYNDMPMDYRQPKPDVMPVQARPTEDPPRQSHGTYPVPAEQYPPVPYGQVTKPPSHASGSIKAPPASEYGQFGNPYVEHGHHRSQIGNTPVQNDYRNHPEYATMQPRVEDEEDEGPPPPPPVHRSGLAQPTPMPQQPSYQAYSPDQPVSANSGVVSSSGRPVSSHSSHSQPRGQFPDPVPQTNGAMPASLVAGYDPIVAEEEAVRAGNESRVIRRNSAFAEEPPVPFPEPLSCAPPYPVDPPPQTLDEQRGSLGSRGSAQSDSRVVQRKSVSPKPPLIAERESSIPFSPDSYDVLNPNAARSAVIRDPKPAYDTPAGAMDAARRSEAEAARDGVPIIGDDGKEIDPSDHLPTDTWAPEPEKKNRKPEVIIRFKNPRTGSAAPRAPYKPQSAGPSPTNWRHQSYVSPDPSVHTPPRGREAYAGRGYGTPNSDPPLAYRKSVSPSPSHSPSSFYEPSSGPPIPAKVPIAQPVNQSYSARGGNPGMDALSRELKSIDIGSVGCSPGRGVRRHAPKASVTGYAVDITH